MFDVEQLVLEQVQIDYIDCGGQGLLEGFQDVVMVVCMDVVYCDVEGDFGIFDVFLQVFEGGGIVVYQCGFF